MRRVPVLLFVALALSASAQYIGPGASSDDAFVKIGDTAYLSQTYFANVDTKHIKNILYPVLGCPAIVKPNTNTIIIIKSPIAFAANGIYVFAGASGDKYSKLYGLPVNTVAFDSLNSVYKVKVSIPALPEDVYNLKIALPALGIMDTQYCCLRVRSSSSNSVRYAVTSDAHFNDPRGWYNPANHNAAGNYNPYTIMKQMYKELKNQQVDFVMNCGDTVFGTNYGFEYDGAWNLWKDSGVAVFMVPGNHDGQASIKQRTILGITCPKRDGLDYFRANFGPAYYSFNFGGNHFLGINTMDGTPQRRDGFYILLENWGGDLLPQQMQFISDDLAGVSSNVVPFSHHVITGPYKPNGTFTIWGWLFNAIITWIQTGTLWGFWNSPDYFQEWNTQATADFIKQQIQGKCNTFITGHYHSDVEFTQNGIFYKRVTASGSDSGTYWGYALISMVDGAITDQYYNAPSEKSYPTGNLLVEEASANNGTQSEAAIKVTNYLTKPRDLVLEFYVKKSNTGYQAPGGIIQGVENLGMNRVKVRAKFTIAAAGAEITSPTILTFKVKPQ